MVEQAGGIADVTTQQGSIYAEFRLNDGSIYPVSLSGSGQGQISLNLQYLKGRAAFASDAARKGLYDHLVGIVGPLSNSNLSGYPAFRASKLNDPAVQSSLQGFLEHIRDAAGTTL